MIKKKVVSCVYSVDMVKKNIRTYIQSLDNVQIMCQQSTGPIVGRLLRIESNLLEDRGVRRANPYALPGNPRDLPYHSWNYWLSRYKVNMSMVCVLCSFSFPPVFLWSSS